MNNHSNDQILKEFVSLIVFDFDGVLTDNKVLVLPDGTEAVVCNRSDGIGFDLIRRSKIPVLIMSTETNPIVTVRSNKLKVKVLQSVNSKKDTIVDYCKKEKIELHKVMFIGNDINDLEAMEVVGIPVAVFDSDIRIKRIAKIVTNKRGGDGVAREIAEEVLKIDYFEYS